MDLFEKCAQFTEHKKVMEMGFYPYFKVVSSAEDTEAVVEGKKVIMLGSNNYLGLTTHPKVKEAAKRAIEEYGTGSCGSRFLNGTLDLHIRLEEKLAEFVKKEAALVFSTGFQTNLGIISSLVGKNDILYMDKWNHASLVDGARLSLGQIKRFKHNDMNDLERVLRESPPERGKFIAVDGLFSMEGDIVKLPQLVQIAKKYGARILVDDAHAMGVLGKRGAGTTDHFGLEDEVDLVMGTFSKSFASLGGFVAGDKYVIDYIKHHARSLIFSASMPPAAVATVEAALDIIINEPERREKLWHNTHKMLKAFKEMGFDTGISETPVIPLVVGDDMLCFRMWRELLDNGVYVNPVISPAVPPGRALLRTSYMATHTDEQLDRALDVFYKVGKKFGVI